MSHDIFQQPTPVCPHCGHALDTDEMLECREDLFALAPAEGETEVTCPVCDLEYAILACNSPATLTA